MLRTGIHIASYRASVINGNLLQEEAMERLLKKFEDIMVAITFAESGDYETAISISGGSISGDRGLDSEPRPKTVQDPI